MHGVIPSIRRLRGLVPPGWRGAAAGALALTLPLSAVGLAMTASGHHGGHPAVHPLADIDAVRHDARRHRRDPR